jgi:hypothetical protein
LVKVLLLDSGRLQEEEAEFANRQGFSKHSPALNSQALTSPQVHDANPQSDRRLCARFDPDQTALFSERHCFDKNAERFSHVKPKAFQPLSRGSGMEQSGGAQVPALDGHAFLET